MNLTDRFLFFDGSMGTLLQTKNLPAGVPPETYNITHPDVVLGIHRDYVAAGSNVVSANTFQANAYKLKGSGYTPEEVITAAVGLAKKSKAEFVALDLGPTGQLMEPNGTLRFDDAYELYKQQIVAGVKAGADIIVIETIADMYEAKAAILAAKENCKLPVFCTMTFQADGRTFVGNDARTAALTLQALGADAIGLNCSLGPDELAPLVDEFLRYAKVPVMIQPNAGLPHIENGETVFKITPTAFAATMKTFAQKGAKILGGCCGTTPAHISEMITNVINRSHFQTRPLTVTAATSATRTVVIGDGITVIGERINPTGKKKLKEALKAGDFGYVAAEALDQAAAGADILDVNVGLPEIDEPETLARAVREVSAVVGTPLQIDSADPAALERAARIYNGIPIINSVNGKREVLDAVLPIVKKYGALVVGLTLDESGIPETADERVRIAEKIAEAALVYGIPRENILIDALTLTASSHQKQVAATLETVKRVRRLGLKTVLGVSNVSFGMPNRPALNRVFLAAAFGAGLNAAIMNPLSAEMAETVAAFKVLNAQDADGQKFIEAYANTEKAAPTEHGSGKSLKEIIIEGRRDESAAAVRELLKTAEPLAVINEHFMPALDEVGRRYETGKIFLPQLIRAAETVGAAFEVLKASFGAEAQTLSKGKILLATVKGDVHDIGKNIVKVLLENYGYEIVDMGKDVPIEAVVKTANEQNIKLVGLSALMTTTVKSMKETVDALRASGSPAKVMVGGAVLNPEYAGLVGADFYARDAKDGVNIAAEVFKQ